MKPRAMKRYLRGALALLLVFASLAARADARVFELVTPQPEQLLASLRSLYGDSIRADLIQQRLVVVGSQQQLDDIDKLLRQLDRAPAAQQLTLSRQAPASADSGSVTYSTAAHSYRIDTVEGAPVTLEYSKIAQQPAGNGWWVSIANVPTAVQNIVLQVHLQGARGVLVTTSFTREENQRRRVYTATREGALDSWLPLLPAPAAAGKDTLSTPAKAGSQLYLRVTKGADTAEHSADR
jgi:hypothetical protein